MTRTNTQTTSEPPCIRLIHHFYDEDERTPVQIAQELEKAEEMLKLVTVPLAAHQRQALLSFLSDLAGGHAAARGPAFERSELLRAINCRKVQVAASEMYQFVYVNGMVSQRLWEKRTAEQILFRKGTLKLRG